MGRKLYYTEVRFTVEIQEKFEVLADGGSEAITAAADYVRSKLPALPEGLTWVCVDVGSTFLGESDDEERDEITPVTRPPRWGSDQPKHRQQLP